VSETLVQGLRAVLADLGSADPGEPRVSAIPGGASRQALLVETGDGDASLRYVLRRDPPGAESFNPLELEVRVIEAAAAAGAPVPNVLRFEPAGGAFESAGFLMDHLEGTSVAPRLLRRDEYSRARQALPGELAAGLARIHAVDPAPIEGLPGGESADPALEACDVWERALDEVGAALPALEAGLRRLRMSAPPPPERIGLVHGDFRLGNFIASEQGLEAVIDWELCHRGDPAEDIGWICVRSWRFGNDDRPVAGLGDLGDFLAAYEASGGTVPEPKRIRWWEAMGNVKWAVICARQAHDHLSGERRSHELASLGRRICEPEWDLLELVR
jgi:aminoglycoside phosphotransferase (APT) family kinase protein